MSRSARVEVSYMGPENVPVVFWGDIPEDQIKDLSKWMTGQTGIADEYGRTAIFYWDYERWYESWVEGRTAYIWD